MLSGSPSCVEVRDLNPSEGELRERPDPGCPNSELHQPDNVVDAVKSDSSEDVGDDHRLMITYLNAGVRERRAILKESTYGEEESYKTNDMDNEKQSIEFLAHEGCRR
jgi:hypothetical protein